MAKKEKTLVFNDIQFSKMTTLELDDFLQAWPFLKDEVFQKIEEERLGDEFPSKVQRQPWVYAQYKNDYPEHTENGGKWCVLVKYEEIDGWFQKIKAALFDGKLGSKIKSSTRASKRGAMAMIIVYTYNHQDIEDLRRIRNSLKEVGIVWKVSYKTDDDTRRGRYSNRHEVSLFYE